MTPQRTRVPFLDLSRAYGELRQEIDGAVARVLTSGRYLLGAETEAFEAEWASACGTKYAVAVGSGLDALELSLAAIGVGPGDEIVVPGHTFVATWFAVSHVGATPVPVDVDDVTFCIDPEAAEAAITPRTRAIVAVDLYGHPANAHAIRRVCDRHGLAFLEDAAQAHGATLDGTPVGKMSNVSAWSFYPAKNLGALSDGGAITTDDADVAATVRRLRNYGSEQKYVHSSDGRNSRLDELQCAVLRAKLPHLGEWNARRSAVARRYHEGLAGAGATLPAVKAGARPAWHIYAIRVRNRDAVLRALMSAGVECLVHYPRPPHHQGLYADRFRAIRLDVAERICDEELSLPIGPHLDADHVDGVIEAVTEALR